MEEIKRKTEALPGIVWIDDMPIGVLEVLDFQTNEKGFIAMQVRPLDPEMMAGILTGEIGVISDMESLEEHKEDLGDEEYERLKKIIEEATLEVNEPVKEELEDDGKTEEDNKVTDE